MNIASANSTFRVAHTIKHYLVNSVTGTFPLDEKFPFESFDWNKATILNPSENILNNLDTLSNEEGVMLNAFVVVIDHYGKLMSTVMRDEEVQGLLESSSLKVVGIYNLNSLNYIPNPPVHELISLPENARVEYLLNALNLQEKIMPKQRLN